MKYTQLFENISKEDALIAGGKGASLGEMSCAGIPVPPGFVVLAQAFDTFLETNNLADLIDQELSQVKTEDIESLELISKKIRDMILKAQMPAEIEKEIEESFSDLQADLVAVRSSATAEDGSSASWAGELESYLNTNRDTLHENIQRCWASLFSPRAITYRIEQKMQSETVSVAVVVQKMIQSEVSGISFTVHPVTKNDDQMVIEAGWGLGEAIVGGKITPDNYVISKKRLEIEDIYISSQEIKITRSPEGVKEEKVAPDQVSIQKLNKAQIKELAEICLKIENHYGFPCDIEWAFENDEFYIVQSRPITTL